MYNVLEKLRSNSELTEGEKNIYDSGLIGILRELHDVLDRAVFAAYGWPHDLSTEQVLERVVALNAARRSEEASGLIRWLRPEYQAPNAVAVTPQLAGLVEVEPAVAARRNSHGPPRSPTRFAPSKTRCAPCPSRTPPRSPPLSARPAEPESRRSSKHSLRWVKLAFLMAATRCKTVLSEFGCADPRTLEGLEGREGRL